MSVDGIYLSGVRQLSLYTKLRKLSSYTLHLRRWKKHIFSLHYVRKQSSWRSTNSIPPPVNLQWTPIPTWCQNDHYTEDNKLYQDKATLNSTVFFTTVFIPISSWYFYLLNKNIRIVEDWYSSFYFLLCSAWLKYLLLSNLGCLIRLDFAAKRPPSILYWQEISCFLDVGVCNVS